nr:MAG TPA: hypothetical protein [Caudoviricetes sp.]
MSKPVSRGYPRLPLSFRLMEETCGNPKGLAAALTRFFHTASFLLPIRRGAVIVRQRLSLRLFIYAEIVCSDLLSFQNSALRRYAEASLPSVALCRTS